MTREEIVLGVEDLTDKQFLLSEKAQRFPVILRTRGEANTAASLARKGWGEVEDGASGERIFRMSQAGCDAWDWFNDFVKGLE